MNEKEVIDKFERWYTYSSDKLQKLKWDQKKLARLAYIAGYEEAKEKEDEK